VLVIQPIEFGTQHFSQNLQTFDFTWRDAPNDCIEDLLQLVSQAQPDLRKVFTHSAPMGTGDVFSFSGTPA